MAKKEKKAAKAAAAAGAGDGKAATRWTVRGVPARLQKAAGDLARARGQTLGQWLTEAVEAAVDAAPAAAGADGPAAGPAWREAVEARLARLERRLPSVAADGPGAAAAG